MKLSFQPRHSTQLNYYDSHLTHSSPTSIMPSKDDLECAVRHVLDLLKSKFPKSDARIAVTGEMALLHHLSPTRDVKVLGL